MTIVDKKYSQLKPEIKYLFDEVVLSQAWKKSHTYIRSHNWYADTLDLDCSAVNLSSNVAEWSSQISSGTYLPSKIRLIPAPKPDHWTFSINTFQSDNWQWGPKSKTTGLAQVFAEGKELRPLAHLSIKDQTVATAIMLCIADSVETAQGSTDPNYGHRVRSYGNRLFCDWNGDEAKFRWGNSGTYSKYFQDYQRFLERPMRTAQEKQKYLDPTEGLYEVHLDITAFFDSVDRKRLIRSLKKLSRKFYDAESEQSDAFWKMVETTVYGWQWSEEDIPLGTCLKDHEVPEGRGIPQGLVAGGFFANAYLVDLDVDLSSLIGVDKEGILLLDYCRYVDDMRLLIKAPIVCETNLLSWIEDIISPVVRRFGLDINPIKTKVERFTAKRSGVSVRMKAIQQAVSGPQDRAALDEMMGSLEGLFSLAEQFRDQGEISYQNCDLLLARVDQPQMDVREDTLLRFSANRMSKALAEKRLLVDAEETGIDSLNELDHVYESIARRFVAVWSRNPSLVSILKKGFSLFPHPTLLNPVLQALIAKLNCSDFAGKLERERRVSYYCLAEIFRFAALELHQQQSDQQPKHSDSDGFNKLLLHKAKQLIILHDLPWYVQQQIALYFATCDESVCIQHLESTDNYRLLHCILCGHHSLQDSLDLNTVMPLFFVAYQITENKTKVVATLGDWLHHLDLKNTGRRTLRVNKVQRALDKIALNNSTIFLKVLTYGKQISAKWMRYTDSLCDKYGFYFHSCTGPISEFNNKIVSLACIIKRQDNPFAHENAILALALTTISCIEADNKSNLGANVVYLPHNAKVKVKNWSQIQCAKNPTKNNLELFFDNGVDDVRYESPNWLGNNQDTKNLYKLGCFLRACLIGDMDFTAGQYILREETKNVYFGLKSSWYKRRMGMAHQPEALNGKGAPMSSWVSELLYRLLQWPGLNISESNSILPEVLTLDVVKRCIKDRLVEQRKLYGKSSSLPFYVEKIQHDVVDGKHLRVVMVQSLLPQKGDFEKEDLLFNRVQYRTKHRGHLATMARLVCEKLVAGRKISDIDTSHKLADLIIFPELSVHPLDIEILKRLADKTGAMVFAGLTYQKNYCGPINTALWLIPYRNGHGRQWIMRYQGKQHPTKGEVKLGITPWRPYQLVIELKNTLIGQSHGFRLSGAICYDATDISLAADLKAVTNTFIVSALNQDVDTFDTMVDALHYHMYQPVVLVNTGEFGGSAAKAPYKEKFHKLIAHVHGCNQIAISMFELNMNDFGVQSPIAGSGKELKTKPAGMHRT